MAIRLWPSEYEKKDHITKEEKYLLRQASRNFNSGHFVIGINPLGLCTEQVHIGMYISPMEGLITFSVYNGSINEGFLNAYTEYVIMVEEKIYNRLLDSKVLIIKDEKHKILRFPYKHIIIFPNESIRKSDELRDKIKTLKNIVALDFFRPPTADGSERSLDELEIFSGIRKPFDEKFSFISEIECKAIFERLAPEYSVVMNEKETVLNDRIVPSIQDSDFLISGKETEYKTFFLDDYQVAQVNEMGKGHRLILANPGAGKSVLLLSKAFKYSSLYKNSKILLTCYNYNLADAYKFKYSCADFGENNNLYIMTLHKLVAKLYSEYLGMSIQNTFAQEDDIKKCIDKIKSNEIPVRFKAIFIDEVQIFEPLYIELCYNLLDKSDPDYTFLMAGDLNQAVKKRSRNGDVPWKRMDGVNLDFTGRVKYIEKNYRNTKEIAEYISKMLNRINTRFSMLDLINPMEYEYNSFKIGEGKTIAFKVKTGIDRMNIKEEISVAVKELVNRYQISYSDIAILFPYKQHKAFNYNNLKWIKEALDEADIPYSEIFQNNQNNSSYNMRVRYSQTTGVVLSTISASLGLDFKAVILTGLYPYSYVFTEDNNKKVSKKLVRSWSEIKAMNEEEQRAVQSQIRSIYTACSRARECLYVLSDIVPDTPIEEILKI